MAKMFYTADEAAKRLNKSESELKDLIRAGKLREFRDAGKINYKVQDVDTLAVKLSNAGAGQRQSEASSASASGEIVLEAVEDSGIELSPLGSDVVSLEAADADDTRVGMKTKKAKEGTGTVVPSVGVNVFDDDELDEEVDPLAQTAVTDIAGLGIEGIGSGSGIMDLTRESDDTSLGAELLEEIYTGEEAASADPGEDTRAGLDDALPAAARDAADEDRFEPVGVTAGGQRTRVGSRMVVEAAPDPTSTGLTAAMVVAVAVMWIAGLAGASLARGVNPSLLSTIYGNLGLFVGSAFGAAILASGLAWFLTKRSLQ